MSEARLQQGLGPVANNLPPQPYRLKKTSWGRINQRAQSSQTVVGPSQPGAPQLLVLNLFPTASSPVRLCNSTLACFSLQHLTLASFLEGLIPVDSALPTQPAQQKSFKHSHILLSHPVNSIHYILLSSSLTQADRKFFGGREITLLLLPTHN